MGFRALEGSWLEGQDALVSTAVGALAFWLLGAVVGLLVSCRELVAAVMRNGGTGNAWKWSQCWFVVRRGRLK